MLGLELTDLPLIAWYIFSLVILEALLSADNALVLAVMVRHLPREERKKALRYGLWGAFLFRLIAVMLSAVLMKFWIFKVLGGLYLVYLCISHFLTMGKDEPAHPAASGSFTALTSGSMPSSSDSTAPLDAADQAATKKVVPGGWRKSFWGTVVSVELADIAFSIDSILAAVGMAVTLPARFGDNWKLAIVYLGGILGIVTMRFVAGYLIVLLDRFSGLAVSAYLLVGWIGAKLLVSGLHTGEYIPYEIPGWLFWSGMAVIALGGLLTGVTKKPATEKAQAIIMGDPPSEFIQEPHETSNAGQPR